MQSAEVNKQNQIRPKARTSNKRKRRKSAFTVIDDKNWHILLCERNEDGVIGDGSSQRRLLRNRSELLSLIVNHNA